MAIRRVQRRAFVTIPWIQGQPMKREQTMTDAINEVIAALEQDAKDEVPVTVEAMTTDEYGVHLLLAVWMWKD
jgi:non-canonical (house-cleaning) NTP pyrophosphatase